ncbi:MAG: ABC transporter ATP-binding protein [Acidobacteria bacterium]|nr:MAG: ABC transporter ATP-binding protein [Acidobacteriota bacterium]REK02820.1 MAG: ABC transporter ATP-binding protein [Acidobacteriota bacterium]REK13376.1 MAG: ABC transporter ATP-binding protein [Acidobacteriota bacterium]REK41370.1 MAG: ABC transporter ATP-binding protein [Acidobacteriota bacterium]
MEELRKFARYFRPYRGRVVFGVLCILFGMIFNLFVPYLVGVAIDELSKEITWDKVFYYPLVILGVSAVGSLFLFWQRRLLINASRDIEYDMRRDFYDALVDQPLEYFTNTRVGDLMARATNDLGAVRQIVGPMILYSFQAIFALAVVLPIMFSISVKLTLFLLIPLPFVSLTVKFLGQQIHVRFEKIQEFFSGITARAQENLNGARVIRAYAQEDSEIGEFQKLNTEYADKNVNLVKFAAAMRPLLFFFIGLSFVIIIAVGVPMAVNGEITAGEFSSFILYLQRMIWYLIALGYVVNLYQRGTASLKRFNAILETEPTISDAEDVRAQPKIKGRIEFRNLNFAYEDEPTLSGIDLVIEAGKTVALVGKTGSGKSTLVSLIPRILEAPEGTVLVDDIPVRRFPLKQLREAIGFVQQETFLFSNTIESNIAFGVNELDAPQNGKSRLTVEKAAAVAGLAGDIKEFPNKYKQLVGERGITLSGGQKQRTAIARAVMRDPRILILDDSLSAVDTLTEEKILHGLRDVRIGRTTVIVSHRISTIRDADLICVMHEGEIIERGNHEQLIAMNGEYADLYQRQLLEEEIEATE